ncbi:exopolysaccharide biosynthesis polyprenyl glycosylphosphotransferase [Nocardioides sp. Y6]|uniref:Exopolysaccharide biosynthesis polyprenyl glycosylphosphotransferase n=2 Tax=Nocardioides malaquae TaxID=2773426 RepID=A0ABR9RS53_9ACTN|nr:exopolysaccharide biosynthesis polyprenyl glycosylphosphotransferase [Nocardioides malaquae]
MTMREATAPQEVAAPAADLQVVGRSAGAPRTAGASRCHHIWTEIVVAVVAMAVVTHLVGAGLAVALVVVGVSLAERYWAGSASIRPGLPRLEQVVRHTVTPFCVVAVGVAVGVWGRADLVAASAITLAGAAVALAGALARRHFPTPQRVVVVGSAVSVAEAAARWSASPEMTIVGGVVVGEPPQVPQQRTGLSETFLDLTQEIHAEELTAADPDLVLVVPGPGVDAECIRRLGWALEGSRTALAVQSDLDGIATHRLEHATYGGATLVHVASSRPARLPRLVKATMDRVVGTLLLVLSAPLLGVLVLAIRATSSGPGMFRQVRVGQDGSLFTMYKLRTMVTTAEAEKASLLDANEASGVLFKMTADPRITPLGRILRKFSLDELPQLLNVVKGEMSLVGPRPALPEEVAQYTSLERRRLAAKPGLTGLWQVSGRSDLSWEKAIALDNHYTENWRLADDVGILARTVHAVLGSRGAY